MIEYLISAIIFTLISLLIPPLMDGVERKIKACIHSRVGPPITQTWYDLLKLFEKELVIPEGGLYIIILSLLYIMLVVLTVVSTIFMVLIGYPYTLVIIITLLLFIQAIHTTIPFITSNPFAIIGASREVILALVNEFFFMIILGLYMYFTGSPGLLLGSPDLLRASIIVLVIALFISAYIISGRIPFDIAEAEPELASGLLIELSGPVLGMFLLMLHIKRFFVKLLPTILLLGVFIHDPVILLMVSVVVVVIVWTLYSIVAAILGRSRVDLAPITLLKVYIALIALSLLGYFIGV
mgnify:CR=1 FL=1